MPTKQSFADKCVPKLELGNERRIDNQASLPASFASMGIFKTDHLFEEAARSAESCDKLIKRLRRQRLHGLIAGFGFVVIVLGFLVWNLVLANRAFNAALKGVSSSSDTVFPLPASLINMLTPIVLVSIVTQFIWIVHHDTCIKMLLLMRAQKSPP